MSKTSVVEALRALATSDDRRSETARLRDVFDEVEGALKAGVSRAAILETLHQQGFTMTPKSFESALYRLRRRQGGTGESKGARASDSTETPVLKTPSAQQPQSGTQKATSNTTSKKTPLDSKSVFGELAKPIDNKFSAVPDKDNLFKIDEEGK